MSVNIPLHACWGRQEKVTLLSWVRKLFFHQEVILLVCHLRPPEPKDRDELFRAVTTVFP